MKTVTICGSMRFSDEMKRIAFELEAIEGCNALQCTYNEPARALTAPMLDNLARAHFRRIELSDVVYIVDVEGYIGESVKGEIEYARALNKEIRFYSEEVRINVVK